MEVSLKKSPTTYIGVLPFQNIQWKPVFSKRNKNLGLSIETATQIVQTSDVAFQIARASCFPTKLRKSNLDPVLLCCVPQWSNLSTLITLKFLWEESMKWNYWKDSLNFFCPVLNFYIQMHSDKSFSPVSASSSDHKLQAVVIKRHFLHIGQLFPFSLSLISPSNIHPHLPTSFPDRLS